jgi:hypothetical protein
MPVWPPKLMRHFVHSYNYVRIFVSIYLARLVATALVPKIRSRGPGSRRQEDN